MNFDDLARRPSAWLREGGVDADVVVSSRIRLARNLTGYSFVGKATDMDLENLRKTVFNAADKLFDDDVTFLDMDDVAKEDAALLAERRVVGESFVNSARPRSVIIHDDEKYSVMINGEDHLRIQTLGCGFSLAELWRLATALDDKLESELHYAFDDKLGYLTANPQNVGTGLRASVLLHLPALVETNEMTKVVRSLNKLNLNVQGLCGKGVRAYGEFYLVSNQTTLGVSEEMIVEQLSELVPSLVNYEREARQTVLERNRDGLLDRCYRALALLKMARTMSLHEATSHLSSLRLGVRLGLLDKPSLQLVDDALLHIQPAHLHRFADVKGDEDSERACYLRNLFIGPEK